MITASTASDHLPRVQELAVVSVHTWVQGSPPSHVTTKPAESRLDATHGPVLEGVFLSTPALVVLLVGIIAVALVMAVRTAGATRASRPAISHLAAPAGRGSRNSSASDASRAGGR